MVYIKKTKGRTRRFPLYWNFIARPTGEQDVEGQTVYHFLIANTDAREIEDINGIIYGQISRKSSLSIRERKINGKVKNVNYRYLEIDTNNIKLDLTNLKKVYNGNLEKDPRLYPRQNTDQLEEYIVGKLEKLVQF